MAKKTRRAPLPTPEMLEALYAARRARHNNANEPASAEATAEMGVMKTYRVTGNRICHGKKKGDLVDLWDIGATRALVQAGHLVEVVVTKDQAAESADKEKEAGNGR